MPAFHYIALNQDQKELSGVIEAPDEAAARNRLNELKLSVVSLAVAGTQPSAFAQPEGKTIFEFEAIDKNKKKVVGTIVASDPVSAYRRLYEEYQLSVLSLFAANLPPGEKEEAKKLGISSLHNEYEKRFGKKQKQSKEEELALQAAQARSELLVKVNVTIKRIENFLKEYGSELKVEERDNIQAYINQLMRIKDSTNLEHIRITCQKMLEHIQNKELFISEERRSRESAQIKVETKEMLGTLKNTGLQSEIDIVDIASQWETNRLLKPLAKFILRILHAQNPEIRALRRQLKTVRKHFWEYVKMLFSRSKSLRAEAWVGIAATRAEKKRLSLQLKALREQEHTAHAVTSPVVKSAWLQNAQSAAGWILAFYLIVYILSYPFTVKEFGFIEIPNRFYFYNSTFFKSITLLLFLAYGAITASNFWLTRKWTAIWILYPLTAFGFLLIVINLL